ncbi:hypothetical protein EIP91_003309 [Steccherinum ochraceum]|uniref:Uncharacterized protein n=1 Tax=Steccherinum ochraceum TaxID=92696 RepID=A0A4R0RCC9_9APHY|nr:hypothetical protein EIP91_003309 [Steccherinum ochraceum]
MRFFTTAVFAALTAAAAALAASTGDAYPPQLGQVSQEHNVMRRFVAVLDAVYARAVEDGLQARTFSQHRYPRRELETLLRRLSPIEEEPAEPANNHAGGAGDAGKSGAIGHPETPGSIHNTEAPDPPPRPLAASNTFPTGQRHGQGGLAQPETYGVRGRRLTFASGTKDPAPGSRPPPPPPRVSQPSPKQPGGLKRLVNKLTGKPA